jgi:hypothetical protein
VALHFAAYGGLDAVLELLLKRGAKTDVPDNVRVRWAVYAPHAACLCSR